MTPWGRSIRHARRATCVGADAAAESSNPLSTVAALATTPTLCVRSPSPLLAGFPSLSSVVRGVWFPATRLRHPFSQPRAALSERLTRSDAAMRPDHWLPDERDASIFVRKYPR